MPEAGGGRDQVAGDLKRMRAALNTYNAVKEWCGINATATFEQTRTWLQHKADQWAIVQEWIKLKREEMSNA